MSSRNKRSFKALANASWDATASERFRFFLFLGLFVSANLVDLAIPWAIGYTLDIFVRLGFSDAAFRQGIIGIAFYIGLRFIYTLCHHFGRYVQNTVTYTARMYTLEKMFRAFLTFPLYWHVRNHSGENLSKLHRSAGAIESTVGTYVWQIVEGLVKVVFAGVAIFALDGVVAVSVLLTAGLTILGMIAFNKRLTNRIRRNFGFGNKISRICVDYLANIITVKTLSLEPAATLYLERQRDEGLQLSKKISAYSELKWGTTTAGHGLVTGLALMVYFYTHKGSAEPFDVAKVYVLLSYLDRIFAAIGSFTGYYGGLIEAATAYEEATNVQNESLDTLTKKPAPIIDANWGVLSIKDLNFSYDVGERPGLNDLCVDIKRGDKIALVGPSGGGKSSFLKILGGLLQPASYHISTDLQDGIPASDIGQVSLLIPQEPEIFSESLYYNLTMGEDFDEEEMKRYVTICRLDSVLAKLPLGWHTSLAEKGLNLSVGEKQRVALARGLLRAKERPILLLDEPTSSLDPKNEKDVFMALLSGFQETTILTACHRLNLVPLFDRVIYMLNGKVEEAGTFQELIDKQGFFFRAWEDYQKKIGSAS